MKKAFSELQLLDEKGRAKGSFPRQRAQEFYEKMLLIRQFDQKALSLQRQGRIGTYAQYVGEEASQVGSALAVEAEDWVFPSYRQTGSLIAMGVPMLNLLRYWGGDERGNIPPKGRNIFPISIPVGSQIALAMGAGIALKIQKKKSAVLAYFGDGATSRGDFHDGLNFAGVFNAPVVFFCENNQWAISTAPGSQTHAETFCQKAIAYGIQGIRVDGNDVLGVYKATADALARAKQGKGPTLIEAVTYRMSDHTTSDDAFRYRSKEEVEHWKKRDPIERLERFQMSLVQQRTAILKKNKELVEEAVRQYENDKSCPVDDMFQYMYKEMPEELRKQLQYLKWLK